MSSIQRAKQEGFFLVQAAMLLAVVASSAAILLPNMIRSNQIRRVETMAKSMVALSDAAKVYYLGTHCDQNQSACWPEQPSHLWESMPDASDNRLGVSTPIIPANTNLNMPFPALVNTPVSYGFSQVNDNLVLTFGSAAQVNFPAEFVAMLQRRIGGNASCTNTANQWSCISERFGAPALMATSNNGSDNGNGVGGGCGPMSPPDCDDDNFILIPLQGTGEEAMGNEALGS